MNFAVYSRKCTGLPACVFSCHPFVFGGNIKNVPLWAQLAWLWLYHIVDATGSTFWLPCAFWEVGIITVSLFLVFLYWDLLRSHPKHLELWLSYIVNTPSKIASPCWFSFMFLRLPLSICSDFYLLRYYYSVYQLVVCMLLQNSSD